MRMQLASTFGSVMQFPSFIVGLVNVPVIAVRGELLADQFLVMFVLVTYDFSFFSLLLSDLAVSGVLM